MLAHNEITRKVIGLAFRVHNELGPGFLESVYHKALSYELSEAGITHLNSSAVKVYYSGFEVGKFFPDIRIGQGLIIELKAISCLNVIHEVQLVNYLQAIRIATGVLLNFGSPRVQVKRKFRDHLSAGSPQVQESRVAYRALRTEPENGSLQLATPVYACSTV